MKASRHEIDYAISLTREYVNSTSREDWKAFLHVIEIYVQRAVDCDNVVDLLGIRDFIVLLVRMGNCDNEQIYEALRYIGVDVM